MESTNNTRKKKVVLITDSAKNIEGILCKSIFNDFSTQVTKDEKALSEICKNNETIVLSTTCLTTCTQVYKHYLDEKCSLHILHPIDIHEDGLDDDSILRFTLFNFELFRQESYRAKALYILKNTFSDISKDKYIEIYDLELMNKTPSVYINLYRATVFENQTALIRTFVLLRDFDKDTISAALDSLLPFILDANSIESFCNLLISYYIQIDYSKNEDKRLIFLFLNKIYEKMVAPSIQKISASFFPITSYCACEDANGENIVLLDSYVESLPPLSKNLNTIRIVIYSKIYGNEMYHKAFSAKLTEPGNKIEHSYNNTLRHVENVLKDPQTPSIPRLQLKKGVDQYLVFVQDNYVPEEPSPMFDLLLKQSW